MRQQAFELDHAGMMLRGMTYLPDGARRHPAVLLLHGFTGHRIESMFTFVHLARHLASHGIAAVTFDFRHSGESDGSFEQMLVTGELADALRVTDWLQRQPFADRSRLGLLGMSLGGLVAGCVVGRTDAFAALVQMCPTTVANLDMNVCKRNKGCPVDEPVVIGPYTLHRDFQADLQTLDPLADVVKHPRPSLVVHGTGDTVVPFAVGEEYAQAMQRAKVPVRLHPVPGADHGFNKAEYRAELTTAVCDFFVQTLS